MKYCLYKAIDDEEDVVEIVPIANFFERLIASETCDDLNNTANDKERYFLGLTKQ